MTFSLCPVAACVHGHISGFKTAPGVYPRPRMGKVLLYCFFSSFLCIFPCNRNGEKHTRSVSVLPVLKLVQLYRIYWIFGASVLVFSWLPRCDGPTPPCPPSLIRLNCSNVCHAFFSLREILHAGGATMSCVFHPALRAGLQNCPSFAPAVAGAASGPRSVWIQSSPPLSASVPAL